MADCKHELKYLVGMADGIHCTNCGAVLKDIPLANIIKPVVDTTKPAETAEKPKKGGRKNAGK